MRTLINLIVLGTFVCLSNVAIAQDEEAVVHLRDLLLLRCHAARKG